ncbi:MAG: T9SS type A sorting domain-containing protein, partial [Bacteroidota bacterium]
RLIQNLGGLGVDNNFNKKLYYVNSQTAQILYEPILTDSVNVNFFQYDLNSDQLYTLYTVTDSSQQSGFMYYRRTYLGAVDTITAAITRVGNTPVLEGYNAGISVGSLDFDQMTQTLIMVARDDSQNEFRIMGIDVTTGSIVFDSPLTPLQPQVAAVWDVECDNQVFARMAYGESTDTTTTDSSTTAIFAPNFNEGVSLGPVPAETFLRVAWSRELADLDVQIFNTGGQLVQTVHPSSPSHVEIDIASLPAGIYTLVGRSKDRLHFAKKWLKQ